MLRVTNNLSSAGLSAGIITVRGVTITPTPAELREKLHVLIAQRKAEDFPPAELKAAVRDMLRSPHFKPTGRNKPAGEYLVQAAKEDRFPFINNLVDVNNYVSLHSGLPISLLDLEVISENIVLRHGEEGEKYVFNEAGQEIELNGLICACRAEGDRSQPLGNPVKDSMEAKLKAHTKAVTGIIYAPAAFLPRGKLEHFLRMFADMLVFYGQGGGLETTIV